MNAEQLEKEWMAQDKILDFRNWLVAQLIESRGKVDTLLIIARNDAYAAAQLAEKEREIAQLTTELKQWRGISEGNSELAGDMSDQAVEYLQRAKAAEERIAKLCEEFEAQRQARLAAEQRLQEAQGTNRELNRRNQSLQKSLNAESGRKSWHGYFTAALQLFAKRDDECADLRERLRQREAELEQVRAQISGERSTS